MEPQSNNIERVTKNNLEKAKQNPEVVANSEQAKKLEGVPLNTLEHLGGVESHEQDTGISQAGPQAASGTTITLPSVHPTADDAATSQTTGAQTPPTAADDDVIEKEWINKAKTVLNHTKGDPYTKEREVSKLQADYLQKRYGKQVKMPPNDN